jgi:hypothetical protein
MVQLKPPVAFYVRQRPQPVTFLVRQCGGSRRGPKLEVPRSISVPPWPGGPCLELVHEFNERYVELVAQAAREDGEHTAPEIVRAHRALWRTLDPTAQRRASRCPFLLADIQFRDAPWWQRAQREPSWDGGPFTSVSMFSRRLAVELMRDALLVAWYIARLDTGVAATLLAMSKDVASIVAKLGLRQLRDIAEHQHHQLRPRWEHLSSFWGRLLSAAGRDDDQALLELHRHGFQLADAETCSAASVMDATTIDRD